MQEYIEHEGHDIRLLTVGQKSYAIRRSNAWDWRTNVSQGGRAEPLEHTDELHELARRATSAMDLGLAALDLLPSKQGPLYALEINGVPGWRALGNALSVDISQEVLSFIEFEIEKPR